MKACRRLFDDDTMDEGGKSKMYLLPKTKILASKLLLGRSDMRNSFETNLIYSLKGYFSHETLEEDTEDFKSLRNTINFFCEPDVFEDKIGLEVTRLNVSLTDLTMEDKDNCIIDENSPDFVWVGICQLATGENLKLHIEGFYFIEEMYYPN